MADPIIPFSVWESGTNQNSIPANDNSLRNEILNGLVISKFITSQPSSPSDGDIYILGATHTGAQWSTFSADDLVIFKEGSWYAYGPMQGVVVNFEGRQEQYTGSGGWESISSGSVSSVTQRNLIINGRFNINQRQKTGTVTLAAGVYGHDRWKAGASGVTYTFASSGGVTTLTITAGSLIQVVEGNNVRSGIHVLTWTGTAQGKFSGGSYSSSGVTDTLTGGSNATLEFNTGTLTDVQLIPGSNAQSFVDIGDAQELFRCQRYCFRFSLVSGNTIVFMSDAIWTATTGGFITGMFPQSMYATPVLTVENAASQFRIFDPVASAYTTCTAISINVVTSSGYYLLNFSTASGGTAGRPCYLSTNSQQINSLRLEAEI